MKGFTLVEVLVALLVFAVALLGLASLQATLHKNNHDSHSRAVAALLAADMAERLLANRPGVEAGAYDNPTNQVTANPACLGLDSNGSENSSSCTPTELAAHDFYEWNGLVAGQNAEDWHPAIAAQLPNGSGVVCIDSTPNDGNPSSVDCDGTVPANSPTIYAIKIWWYERSDAATHRYIETIQPAT